MIFTSIGFLLIAVIILIKDYKTESTKWMAAVCLLSGSGSLSVVVQETIGVYLATRGASQETLKLITYISTILSNIAHYITPYGMLMYGLSYANIVKKNKIIIYTILFLPSIICFMIFPISENIELVICLFPFFGGMGKNTLFRLHILVKYISDVPCFFIVPGVCILKY